MNDFFKGSCKDLSFHSCFVTHTLVRNPWDFHDLSKTLRDAIVPPVCDSFVAPISGGLFGKAMWSTFFKVGDLHLGGTTGKMCSCILESHS